MKRVLDRKWTDSDKNNLVSGVHEELKLE